MFSQTASMIHTLTFAQLDFGLVAAGVGLLILFLLIGVTPLAWVIATAWEGVTKLRLKAGLKQQVIARTADDRAGHDRRRDRPGPRTSLRGSGQPIGRRA